MSTGTATALEEKVSARKDATNGAKNQIDSRIPYIARVKIVGVCDMIMHRWNVEAVEEKSNAAKGSKSKKSDDVESYVYRNQKKELCIPGIYLRQAILGAAKFRQDPRSPRKSAMDLFKAGLIPLTQLAPIMYDGKTIQTWSYDHKARVQIQRNAITRTRPAFVEGWEAVFEFSVLIPEYILPTDLNDVIQNTGKLIGLADFRPTYGRFQISSFETLKL